MPPACLARSTRLHASATPLAPRSHVAAFPGVICGAAASGNYVWNDPNDIAKLLTCTLMSGPLLTGYTQTINDWYDRDIDAINEPYRPIPSGEAVCTASMDRCSFDPRELT
jgi:4-hydroxybenzoate polyprenyltransferase